MYDKSIMSIDVGVVNLAITVGLITKDYELIEIIWMDVIDITQFQCGSECKLYHQKTHTDWIEHCIQNNYHFFHDVDIILIEQQPPMGFVSIEQLIFSKFRSKAILVAPRSVHAHYNMGTLSYEKRKEKCINYAQQLLKFYPDMAEQFTFYSRQHDIGDSLMQMMYFLSKTNKVIMKAAKRKKIMEGASVVPNLNLEEWFNSFASLSIE
jgi:hypothetical protein